MQYWSETLIMLLKLIVNVQLKVSHLMLQALVVKVSQRSVYNFSQYFLHHEQTYKFHLV